MRAATKKKITDAEKDTVCQMIKDGSPVSEIASTIGIWPAQVEDIAKERKIDIDRENEPPATAAPILELPIKKVEEVEEDPEELKQESKDKDLNEEIDNIDKPVLLNRIDTVLQCGLVAERHDMPTDLFVFSTLSENLMFNYDKQYDICCEFIDQYVGFDENGKALKDIELYVTGLQSPFASMIKACLDKRVNLTNMHYNSRTCTYEPQVMFNNFVDQNIRKGPFAKIIDLYSCYVFNTTEEELIDLAKRNEHFYIVRKCNYGKSVTDVSDQKMISGEAYLIKNFEDIWKIYPNLINSIMSGDSKTRDNQAVFASSAGIDIEGRFIYLDGISKGYNFKG